MNFTIMKSQTILSIITLLSFVLVLLPQLCFSQEPCDLTQSDPSNTSDEPLLIGASTLPTYDDNIFQFRCLYQDDSQKCGFHALKNAFYLLQATQGKWKTQEISEKLNSRDNFLSVFPIWSKIKKSQNNYETEIHDIFTLLEKLQQGSYPFPNEIAPQEAVKFAGQITPFEINGVDLYDFNNIEKYSANLSYIDNRQMQELLKVHRKFKNNESTAHVFILGTPDYDETLTEVHGHWLSLLINKVKGKLEYIVSDSYNRILDHRRLKRKNGVWVKKIKQLIESEESDLMVNFLQGKLDDFLNSFVLRKTKQEKLEKAKDLALNLGLWMDERLLEFKTDSTAFYPRLNHHSPFKENLSYSKKICDVINFYLQENDVTLNELYLPLQEKYLCSSLF